MEALEQGLADCAIIFQYNSLPALARTGRFGSRSFRCRSADAADRREQCDRAPVRKLAPAGPIGFGTQRTVDRRLRNLPGESGVVGACRRLHTGNHTFDRRFLGHAESGGSRHGRLDHISLSHNRWNPTRFGRTANRRQQRIPHSLFRHKKSGRPTGSDPRQRRNRKGRHTSIWKTFDSSFDIRAYSQSRNTAANNCFQYFAISS